MSAMDEEPVETQAPTVGDRLRAARKKKKLSLEDIAAQTRVPQRHLESLEKGDWEHLPAATYSVGFAKSYAGAVDLDRTEIGEQLRAEMGGYRPHPATAPAEVFEPVDPARTMPKGLVFGAIAAVLLVVVLMTWLNNRSLEGNEPEANAAAANVVAAPVAAPTQETPAAQGPVVLSASEPLWMAVYEKGGASHFSGMLNPGTNFTVPQDAAAPLLRTAKPEALKIMVGTSVAPPVGRPGQKVSDVSLLPADLLKGGSAPAAAPASPPPPPAAAPPRPAAARPAASRPPRAPARTTAAPPPPAPSPAATEPPVANTAQ